MEQRLAHRLFETCTSVLALTEAWHRVRRNAGSPGRDGITTKVFSQNAATSIRNLNRDLSIQHYRPTRLRRVKILKPNGNIRWLGIPTITDRIVQTAVSTTLTNQLDAQMSEASFAYRPDRSVEMAAGTVSRYYLQGWTWAVRADIKSFFDEINHALLKQQLSSELACAKTQTLINRFLKQGGRWGRGVAQGSPLSPVLSNWHLTPFDHHFHRGQTRLVRFADDFLILTKNRRAAQSAQRRCETELRDLGLRLNRDKTEICNFEEGFQFLGLHFQKGTIVRERSEQSAQKQTRII